jgi:hypothetical protein
MPLLFPNARSDAMEVTYQLEREDYWQFNKFVINRTPALKRKVAFNLLSPGVIWLGVFWFLHLPLAAYIFLNLAICACWPFYFFPEMKRATIKQAEMVPGALGQHTLIISPEHLRQMSSVSESTVGWHNFTELTEDSLYLLFFMSQRLAFIIPKRAFSTPGQAQTFLETAQAYRQSALDGTTPVLPSIPETWPPAPQRII